MGSISNEVSTTLPTAAGAPGRFALKIWHTDPGSKAVVVDYDNARAAAGPAAGRVVKGQVVLD